jgi:hypothetical protein
MGMRFGVFLGDSEVENMGIKDKSFFRDLEIFDLIVLFCVEYMLTVSCQPFSEMNIIGITSKAVSVVRINFDRSFFDFFQDSTIGQDHDEIG